jgi:hypothetical protein
MDWRWELSFIDAGLREGSCALLVAGKRQLFIDFGTVPTLSKFGIISETILKPR